MAIEFKDFLRLKWYYQILIVAGVSGGLLAGFWYSYLTPIQADVQTKTGQLEELKKTNATARERQKQLAQIKKDALALQAKLDMLKAVLPLEPETDQIFRSVEAQAKLSSLDVRRVLPRGRIDREVYTEFPIDMDVIGTYHNVGAFLDRIRQLSRIVNIDSLRITGRASEGDAAFTSSIASTFTAVTFVYREEPPTAAPPPGKK